MKKKNHESKHLRLNKRIVGLLSPIEMVNINGGGTVRTTLGSYEADCTSRQTTGTHTAETRTDDAQPGYWNPEFIGVTY